MKRHINIPVFIPHLGCPNQCVFCNQRTISGVQNFSIDDVRPQIDDALSTVSPSDDCEIAFFGGSFTGIDRSLMLELLEISDVYVEDGRVSSVRLSTRPDYIDDEILSILSSHHVKTIELGLQSVNDGVLTLSKRGHGFCDEEKACRAIVEMGFDLVGQMMIGLPGSTLENELETARFIIDSGAVAARIYPTVVFKETELHKMSVEGVYSPLTLEDAVCRSAEVYTLFYENGVEILRIGLCASENLSDEDKYYAGPNHSAIGEMVYSKVFLNKIEKKIKESALSLKKGDVLLVDVAKGSLSKAVGQRKLNKKLLIDEYNLKDVVFKECDELCDYEIKINLKGN